MTSAPVLVDCTRSQHYGGRWLGSFGDGALIVQPANGGRSSRIRLPPRVSMADLTPDSAKQWAAVHGELAGIVGSGNLQIAVDVDCPARDLVRAFSAWGLAQYVVHIEDTIGKVRADDYPFLATATHVTFGRADGERDLASRFPGGWRGSSTRAAGPVTAAPGPGPVRVLLVAYFAGACGAVGAKRINYWASELAVESESVLTVDVASAMPDGLTADARHHFVPDHGRAELMRPPFADVSEWAWCAVEREVAQSRKFSTVGYYWRYGLERYFAERADRFDAVVISGNPFAPFEFASWAKRRWGAAVILDYRDPFAYNPRMQYGKEAREDAAYLERGYNLACDLVTVVNDDCIGLVAGPRDAKIRVVQNGFDDRILNPLLSGHVRSPGDVVTLAHAGSFYADRSPNPLVAAMEPGRERLIHVGPIGGLDQLDGAPHVTDIRGTLPYLEAMTAIADADLGVVYVTETGFETPTKIYDYLGLGLEVLVITAGPIGGGALGRSLHGLPGVHWVSNRREDIRAFLDSYAPGKMVDRVHRERFARRFGTRRLLDELRLLLPPR